jgi:preprotein translocase subunit SecG
MNVLQIIVAVLLIGLIMIQSKGGGLGSAFGGLGGTYRSKRGVERALYILTIVVSLIFFLMTVVGFIFF